MRHLDLRGPRRVRAPPVSGQHEAATHIRVPKGHRSPRADSPELLARRPLERYRIRVEGRRRRLKLPPVGATGQFNEHYPSASLGINASIVGRLDTYMNVIDNYRFEQPGGFGCVPGSCPTASPPTSARGPLRKPWTATAGRRSSTRGGLCPHGTVSLRAGFRPMEVLTRLKTEGSLDLNTVSRWSSTWGPPHISILV